MRTRTIFIILLILVALVAFGPALIAVGSELIAEHVFGCETNLNYTIRCVIGGKDYGQTFYDLGFLICSVFTAGWIATSLGCVLNEGDVHPCPFHGFDLGEMLYGMAVMGWFALGTLPLGAIVLALLLLAWIIVTIQDRNRARAASQGPQ